MYGGEISGNKAPFGGGVCDRSGNVRFSGNPTIEGNTVKNGVKNSNLCLLDTKTALSGALDETAKVYVTLSDADKQSIKGVFTDSTDESAVAAKDYDANFFGDNTDYIVWPKGDELKLLVHEHDITITAEGGTITKSRKGEGPCDILDHDLTLTIAAPLHKNYGDGEDPAAVITDEDNLRGDAKVWYQTWDGTESGEKTETPPTDPGSYRAGITVENVTAYVDYEIEKTNPVKTVPSAAATYGQKLGDLTLSNPEGNASGTWSWVDETESVGNVGSNTFKASFVPEDTDVYQSLDDVDISVTVAGKEVTVKALAQTINEGESIATGTDKVSVTGLLNGHSLSGITLTADADNKNIIPSLAVIKDESNTAVTGNYEITYENGDLTVRAAISAKVTFKVVNGSWSDESSTDKVVTLKGFDGDTLKLTADDIPNAGSKPKDDTFKRGSWDTVPDTETEFDNGADVTYIYTYAKKELATVVKAPKEKTLTYNGSAQELVTAGVAEGGTMMYALGTDASTAPTGESAWSVNIPAKTEAGTCYVWYMAKGDADHISSAANAVTVKVSAAKVTVRALAQTIKEGDSIDTGIDKASVTGLISGHSVSGITLTADLNTATYSNNVKAGKATVVLNAVEGSECYGSKTFRFTMVKGILPWLR